MSEQKKKMNNLATKYRELTGRERDKLVAEIHKKLGGLVYRLRGRYRKKDLNRIDFESVASIALLKALNKYDIESGNFDSYYGTWVRSEVTREIINHAFNIKLPEYLNKPMNRITREEIYDIDNPSHKELILEKYKLKDRDYEKIIHYRSVTKEIERDCTLYEDDPTLIVERKHDIKDALERVFTEEQYEIVCRIFGFDGRDGMGWVEATAEYGSGTTDAILNIIKNSEKLKQLLEGYQ